MNTVYMYESRVCGKVLAHAAYGPGAVCVWTLLILQLRITVYGTRIVMVSRQLRGQRAGCMDPGG